MSPLKRIYPRLLLSFGTAVVVALLSAALLFFSLVSRAEEERLERDMERAAQVISDFGSSLSEGLVHRLGRVLGSEVAIVVPPLRVTSSSLPTGEWSALRSQLEAHFSPNKPVVGGEPFSITLPSGRFTALIRPLKDTTGAAPHWLALLRPAAPELEWKRRIAAKVAWITMGAITLVALLGHQLARRITRPIQELSAVAGDIAAGKRSRRVRHIGYGEVRSLAEAFNTMAVQLQETEERRLWAERQAVAGRLAATVAHEVRNPLSSVQMLVQMARDRLQREPGLTSETGYMEVVLREVERVELVVQDLLDLAHPRPLRPRSSDLEAVAAEVAELTEAQLTHQGIALSRTTEGSPRPVMADPERVKQVILNLLLNGATAMADGGALTLTTRWPPATAPEVVEIAVHDSGRGIDPSQVETLFEPFRAGHPTGSGIGLAVSRQIARDHGGDLRLAPADGGGTVATLSLPLAPPASSGHDGDDRSPTPPQPSPPRTTP